MIKSPSPLLRSALAVLLLSPSFASVDAAAQVVNAAASGASAISAIAGAAARAPLAIGVMPLLAPSLSVNLAQSPRALPTFVPSAPAAFSAANSPAAAPAAAPAGRAAATASLTRLFAPPSNSKTAAAPTPAEIESRINVLFDDQSSQRTLDAAPVAGFSARKGAPALDRSVPAVSPVSKPLPSAAAKTKRPAVSTGMKILLAAAGLLAAPTLALAATAAAPAFTAAASISLLASIRPLASAVGAVGGAIYGMFASRRQDGSSAPSGEVFASMLHYGVLGGAAMYVLLDLSQIIFVGQAAVLQPLPSAVAAAALGRAAFQDKFTDPATTSADRIMGAFPAVAAAVGLNVGVVAAALAAPALSVAIALSAGAMTATGVASALYAALFKAGQSRPDGPARMAKGYVLQALMSGLGLALTGTPLFWPFALMGAAGFGLVLWTTALEVWAHRPGAPAQPLPPAPPAVPAPPAKKAPAASSKSSMKGLRKPVGV